MNMNRFFQQICCLVFFSITVLHVTAQSEEEKKLIAASQAGASPLFFNPDTGNVPLIAPGNYYNGQECTVRGGLPNFFAKVQAGKPVTIGYIGGSITQGIYCYRSQSAKYINAIYPGIKKTWLNAGVSGTGTDLGACRINDQLLQYHPDLIFVEFAVNGAYRPGMEGIIRQIIKHNPGTDICLIYTALNEQIKAYQAGRISDNIQGLESIADYYHLPSIHLAMEAAQLEKEGKLIWKGIADTANGRVLFSADGTHPAKEGGNLYAAAIARGFEKLKANAVAVKHVLLPALISDNWENATMIDPLSVVSFDTNWTKTESTKNNNLRQFAGWFPYIMQAAKPGASFTFRFKGNMFGIFDVGGPEAGQIEIVLDGKPVKLQEISASGYRLYKASVTEGKELLNRFNNFCNNRYRGQYEFIEVTPGEHTVKLSISSVKADKVKILGERQLADITANPDKYDQTVFFLGKILLRGEALPLAPQKLTQQEKWEQKVKAYERKDSLHPPVKNGILFTGSSTIENWKTIEADFPDKPIISRGISGTKTTDLLLYANRVINPYQAKQIFLYEGDNDLGFAKTPQLILKDFSILFDNIRAANKKAEIIFISIKPSPRRVKDLANMEQTNSLIKDFLKGKKNTAYADVFYPMLTSDKKLVPAYYREDSLHLTAAGYKVWTDVIRPFLK
jgi:lysophospholipase L1-like esterase